MKFIFFTVPAYGHLNPMLGIVKELVKKGHHVIIYNLPEFKDKIEEAGAEFRLPPINFKNVDFRIMKSAVTMAELSLYATSLMVEPSVTIVKKEKPDCIIHDSLSLWGKLIGIHTGVPTISLIPSLAINFSVMLSGFKYLIPDLMQMVKEPGKIIKIMTKYRLFYSKAGKTSPLIFDIFSNEEKLNIAFTSDAFQISRKSFSPHFKFVGPVIYDRDEKPVPEKLLETKKPVIYIAMGTVYNDNVRMYRSFVNTFKNTPYRIFISIGKYIKVSDLGEIPENIYIGDYLPQLEILKKTTLFLSHGGMNSVNESLYFGVPMLLFPQIQEQRLNSARVEELGAGIYYKDSEIDERKLLHFINEVLTNHSYKKNAMKIGKTLKDAGGSDTAVKYILDYLQ